MTHATRRTTAGLLALAALLAIAIAIVASPGAPQAASSTTLNGTFRLQAGSYSGGTARTTG